MKVSEKKAIEQWAARLSDAQLEQAYYDAAYDTLGSRAELMYDRGYDMADIREQEALEKYQDEKADLLESLCVARGIRLWVERQDAPEDAPVRLIDANAEKAKVDVIINSLVFGDEDEEMLAFMNTLRQLLHTAFDEAPTIEAEPVRHGRWIFKGKSNGRSIYQCSECKNDISGSAAYCKECGAKMDLKLPEETEKGESPC